MLQLPGALTEPTVVSGRVVAKVLLDLTVYLRGPSESELAWLIEAYRKLCPHERLVKYKIAEFDFWPLLARPSLTASSRAALQAGVPDAFLEPVRRRIRARRAFEVQFWDGYTIDDSQGAWSFNCQKVLRRSTHGHAFVRFLFPLDTPVTLIVDLAMRIADAVDFRSGHAGLSFTFDPWFIASAFDAIHAKAKRFWGVDIEDLNHTLPLVDERIKGVNWLTLVSKDLIRKYGVESALNDLSSVSDISRAEARYGALLLAGTAPAAGDRNHAQQSLAPYLAVARALSPLFLDAHPDFPGPRFIDNHDTTAWLRRFLEPGAWQR
jgi:hypothetical protein